MEMSSIDKFTPNIQIILSEYDQLLVCTRNELRDFLFLLRKLNLMMRCEVVKALLHSQLIAVIDCASKMVMNRAVMDE